MESDAVKEEERPETVKGRPTVYTPELGETICELLAEGMTLNAICKRNDIPVSESTVRSWAINAEHPFSANYARAREVGYHKMGDDIMDIADATETDPGQVARDRLRVETRKWKLSKALPKIYGDKLELNGSLEIRTHEDRLKEIAAMKASLAAGAKSDEEGEE